MLLFAAAAFTAANTSWSDFGSDPAPLPAAIRILRKHYSSGIRRRIGAVLGDTLLGKGIATVDYERGHRKQRYHRQCE